MPFESLPPHKIVSIIERAERGETPAQVAASEGINETTARKYIKKYIPDYKPKDAAECIRNAIAEMRARNPASPVFAEPKPLPPIGKRIAVIPDMQVKPGIDLSYCSHIGKYLAHKKPDIILNGGDFADMPSLNTYDLPGSKGMEGQRYKDDILAVQTAMRLMMAPIKEEMARTGWKPRLVLTLGNHEDRINRALKATPKLEGVIGLSDLHYEEWGYEVIPFLQPITIEGIAFCHYFASGVMGRPITTARALLTKLHMSCFAFHQQGRDVAFGKKADGSEMTAILCGSCYPHDEGYLNHQTNNHWRGLYFLNDAQNGAFEENAVSLRYLARKYGN